MLMTAQCAYVLSQEQAHYKYYDDDDDDDHTACECRQHKFISPCSQKHVRPQVHHKFLLINISVVSGHGNRQTVSQNHRQSTS